MTDLVVESLKNAGWELGRHGDRNRVIEMITNEGYEPFEKVVDFLVEFEGLRLSFKNLRNGIEDDSLWFDYTHATNLEVPERLIEDYSPRIGMKVCIIGTAYRDHLVLLMAFDGSVYGGYDDLLYKIGKNGLDAIEGIILNREFERIN